MAAPIFSGMAAFADNFGKAYGSEKRRLSDEEERKAERAWRDEQREWQRSDRAKADKLNTDLSDAAAPRTTMQGTVTEAGGNKYLSADPVQATKMREMLAAEAEMTGAPAPTQQQGAAITGDMSRGHEITTAPVDAAKLNDPNARNQRVTDALMRNGQIERAMTMESTALDQQAKRLGLKSEELKFIDQMTRKQMGEALASGATWHEGAAKFITESQFPGIKDIKAESVVSPDGKTVTLFAVMPDGTKQARGTFPAGEEGAMAFMEKFGALPIETRMSLMQGRAAAAQTQANADREFDLRKTESESNQQYRARMLGIQQAQEARAAAVHRTTMEDAKIPPGVKMQAASLAKQIENIGSALNKAMAEGQFDPNNPGTARLLEQQTALNLKYSLLVKPYIPGAAGGAAGADPLGLSSPPAGGAPAAPGAPAAASTPPGSTAASPVAAPVTPAAQPPRKVLSLADALAGPGADKTLRGFADQKAGEVQALADGVRAAQAAVVQAAQGGNQAAVQAAMQRVAAERARLNQSLAGMTPQQAQQVLQAAGIQ